MMHKTPTVAFRLASCDDAAAISGLYKDAYRPVSGGDAKDFYPYPQLLACEAVKDMMGGGAFQWVVAEVDGTVIGACGAVVNVGGAEDKIAEVFGLVIREDYRFCGYGTKLFAYLDDFLMMNEQSMFVIAETRTAHPGGWKVVRRRNFIALGFEPAAHLTPAGNESMLLAGKVSPRAFEGRDPSGARSIRVKRLSLAVLKQIHAAEPSRDNDGRLESAQAQALPLEEKAPVEVVEIAYDEPLLETIRGGFGSCATGVIHLNRMRGGVTQSERFERKLLLALRRGERVGYALADLDIRDQRVKIVELTARDGHAQEMLLKGVLAAAEEKTRSVFSCVVESRSDDAALHALLEKIGFFPTAYYPAFIFGGGCRIDCVQFTHLHNVDLAEACRAAELGDWPEASAIKGEICKGSLPER